MGGAHGASHTVARTIWVERGYVVLHPTSHAGDERVASAATTSAQHGTQSKGVEQCVRSRAAYAGYDCGFDQVPQLSSSRMIDVGNQFRIVPPEATGRRRVSSLEGKMDGLFLF